MENMKAVRVHNYGGPELQFEDAPRPTPGSDELLVRVHAASVNPIDWKVRAGYMKDYIPLPLPFIPGWDVSGVVEALGSGVTKFKKGDEVYSRPDVARKGEGAYAEYVVVKESETAQAEVTRPCSRRCHSCGRGDSVAGFIRHGRAEERPNRIDPWRSRRRGQLRRPTREMEGSARDRDSIRPESGVSPGMGVDEPIDYERTRFEDVVHDVDVVFDPIGGDTQKRSWKVLKKGGILVSIVAPPSADEAAKHGVRSAFLSAQAGSSLLAELAELADSGKIKPMVETVLPLSEARKAHELNETGHARGKIVLKVAA